MKPCGIDRRGFLRSAAATALLGALGGRRLFAVPPGWKPSGARRLVFGIISDTHYMLSMDFSNGYRLADGTTDAWVLNALKYFRSRNVDAVMHCGDISNWGLQEDMQLFANSWFSVFPGNKAPDGHEVVKLFVAGNHDIEGYTYNTSDRIVKMFGSNYQSHLLVNGLNGLVINGTKWKNIWGEDYVNTWHKTVKGYHFFGYNTYGDVSGSDVKRSESEQEFIDLVTAAGAAGELDGTKPVLHGGAQEAARFGQRAACVLHKRHWILGALPPVVRFVDWRRDNLVVERNIPADTVPSPPLGRGRKPLW